MAWYSRENRRRNVIVLAVGSVGFLALMLYGQVLWSDYHYVRRERQASAERQHARDKMAAERKANRVVHVTERYDLSWPARDKVPGLKMSIPVVELGGWRAARNPEIKETLQGPDKVELVVPLPQEMRLAVVEMFRDDVKPGPGEHDERIAHCAASFLHRGRYVKVHIERGSRCSVHDKYSKETKAYAVEEASRFLERLMFETGTPASLDMQLERLRKARVECKAPATVSEAAQRMNTHNPGARHQAGLLCGYAVALGHTVLKQAPAEASEPMLASMMAWSNRSGSWDHFYLEDILAALASIGQSEGPLAIAAHALRVKLRNDLDKPEIAQAKRESLDALFALAPKLTADDPLQQVVKDAFPDYLDVDDATRLKIHGVMRLWHEKAAAQDPASDLALRTRLRLCLDSMYAPVPELRKELGRCADDFLAIWKARVASGQGMQGIGTDEAGMAFTLTRLHYSYAFASKDFRGGVEGLRRVDKFARTRIPPASNPYLYSEIRKLEEMFVAKGQAAQ